MDDKIRGRKWFWTPDEQLKSWMKQKFVYEPDAGIILDKASGNQVGFFKKTNGYYNVSLYDTKIGLSKQFSLHRLAWFLYYDEWPEFQIDHKDRDRLNNRIDNLRPASQQNNSTNCSRRLTKDDGKPTFNPYKGAYWSSLSKSWYSSIRVEGKTHYLGKFDTPEAAAEAYKKAAENFHGTYSNGGIEEVASDRVCQHCGTIKFE